MLRIRAYEDYIAKEYPQQEMRCPVHLSIGQEAVPAALSQILEIEDLAVSTHRSHAHYLAKGGSGKRFIAELYGKETGCSGGKGGSMHLIDLSVGFKGSTAIVGNTIPIGVGLGLAIKLNKQKNIAVIYLGDGAVEEGVFYEAVNFAALKNLPVLFVCENNLYSVYSSLKVRQPENREIYKMVEAMGIETSYCDGNDVEASYNHLNNVVEKMKSDSRPHFVELPTYRWLEHCGPNYDNHIGYRTEEEFLKWKNQDPIALHEQVLLNDNIITMDEISEFKEKIDREVTEAFDFAKESKFPKQSEAFKHLYKEN